MADPKFDYDGDNIEIEVATSEHAAVLVSVPLKSLMDFIRTDVDRFLFVNEQGLRLVIGGDDDAHEIKIAWGEIAEVVENNLEDEDVRALIGIRRLAKFLKK